MGNTKAPRPLSEVSPMAQRRNSPSWNQTTKMMIKGDSSSPFASSPFNKSSPRLFWQGRDSGSSFGENRNPYDPEPTYSSAKRPSIENLKRASRVKNSSIFAREQKQGYDPADVRPLQRPLANRRPYSMVEQSKTSTAQESPTKSGSQQAAPENNSTAGPGISQPTPPSKDQPSPPKSSLSKASRFGKFDPAHEIWSDADDSNGGHRHAKSVTFDAAPPQVNEYEMTTPDPSSIASESRDGSYDSEEEEEEFEDNTFDCDSSLDQEDSFDASLEDTEKTPVVLPEDWQFMSPASANGEQVQERDDPFAEDQLGSHDLNVRPSSQDGSNTTQTRMESLDSNSERRPLPPIPTHGASPGGLSAALERASCGQRSLPVPPGPPSYSKEDISELGRGSMTLEDRVRLMMIHEDDEDPHQEDAEKKREDGKIGAPEQEPSREDEADAQHADDQQAGDQQTQRAASPVDLPSPPRISRESILRNIKKQDLGSEDSYEYSSQPASSPYRPLPLDPDVPIPSVEHDNDEMEESVVIKEEETEDEDIYGIPEYYSEQDHEDDTFINNERNSADDDNESKYSHNCDDELKVKKRTSSGSENGQATPVPPNRQEDAADEPSADDSRECSELPDAPALNMSAIRESLQRPGTPDGTGDDEPEEEPSTPESVIRHPVSDDVSDNDDEYDEYDESVPDPVATVKAPGSGLKARPSLTPMDTESMAAARREVSGPLPPMSPLSKQLSNSSGRSQRDAVPEESQETGEEEEEQEEEQEEEEEEEEEEEVEEEEEEEEAGEEEEQEEEGDDVEVRQNGPARTEVAQRKSSLVKLEIPVTSQDASLFGLDEEFDRVIEAQKVAFELSISQSTLSRTQEFTQDGRTPRTQAANPKTQGFTPRYGATANRSIPRQRGYLMRQNTRVIVASSENDENQPSTADNREAKPASGARKTSQPTWTTVPWNGQMRRPSIKLAGSPVKKKAAEGAVPPLPGQPSAVQDAIAEDDEPLDTFEEGEERGRLFVKVIGIKDLDLPLPRGERTYFSLTLDNGIHCVTTAWLELGKSAPIGQEFELIVQNDLEFQLTLQMKIDEAKLRPQETVIPSPTKQKASTFSRVFQSPRKRKELEMKQQLEAQQLKQMAEAKAKEGPWEKLRTLIARDGSFARAYVSLSDYENNAFGRPYSVEVACFNEWAVEEQPSSLKSKKSTSSSGPQKRPPYKVGNLELQLLYVPKPKGAKDEDMPKSMNACIREMREAENAAARTWEGFLSQQGGDCPYWRRRFFRLQGTKLTAYHETTRQPRATINLAKATKLIDDKSVLTQKETSTKGGGRRKSAFAEEEEGYMFVEEGFRIRFANGEVIDFYADSAAEKEGWMKVLGETVGKGHAAESGQVKAWTEIVLKRERSLKAKREAAERALGSGAAPPAPVAPTKDRPGSAASAEQASVAAQKTTPRHQHSLSQPEVRSQESRKQKTRSLIF